MQRPALLVLVRHAESLRNKVKGGNIYFVDDEEKKSIQGIPDHEIPITREGAMRAEKTGIALREKFGIFDYAYHSGYKRTTDTLNLLLRAYPQDEKNRTRVRMNAFIRERDSGHAYDMTEEEVEKHFPYLKEYWKMFGGFFAHPPGGESLAQVVQRVYLFINMLFRDRAGQKILVVTHGETLRCFRFLLEHWNYGQALQWPPGQKPENCGVTVYAYDSNEEHLVLKEYNAVYE